MQNRLTHGCYSRLYNAPKQYAKLLVKTFYNHLLVYSYPSADMQSQAHRSIHNMFFRTETPHSKLVLKTSEPLKPSGTNNLTSFHLDFGVIISRYPSYIFNAMLLAHTI